MPKHNLPELDAALLRHTKDKSLQRQVDRLIQEVERYRHRKPIEVIKPSPESTRRKDDWKRVIIPDSHGNHIARRASEDAEMRAAVDWCNERGVPIRSMTTAGCVHLGSVGLS